MGYGGQDGPSASPEKHASERLSLGRMSADLMRQPEPPNAECYKQKPTLRTWMKRYVRIQGRSLNFYNNEDAELPRGSSIADVTGCEVTTPRCPSGVSGMPFALSRSNWFMVEVSREDLMGGGKTDFCFADESLRDIFAAALKNLAEGREWNVDQVTTTTVTNDNIVRGDQFESSPGQEPDPYAGADSDSDSDADADADSQPGADPDPEPEPFSAAFMWTAEPEPEA